VTANYTYAPYGTTSSTGAANASFQFAGRENDGAANLYYYRARYYSAQTGRFISQDPIGLSGGINVYAYANGNPVSFIDPLGLFDINFGGGFHLPISLGIAVGPQFGSTAYGWSENPMVPLTSDPPKMDWEVGAIADIGVTAGISDISNTHGACAAPVSLNFGLGRYGGIQITPRVSQDKSKWFFDPTRYIDGISFGLGIGLALPVTASHTTDFP
jgi:RHS repeat-associated protein